MEFFIFLAFPIFAAFSEKLHAPEWLVHGALGLSIALGVFCVASNLLLAVGSWLRGWNGSFLPLLGQWYCGWAALGAVLVDWPEWIAWALGILAVLDVGGIPMLVCAMVSSRNDERESSVEP